MIPSLLLPESHVCPWPLKRALALWFCSSQLYETNQKNGESLGIDGKGDQRYGKASREEGSKESKIIYQRRKSRGMR